MKTKLFFAACLALSLFGFTPPAFAQTATVEFASPTYTANELDGGVTIMLVRSAAGAGPNGYASVVVHVTDGTATLGVDYAPPFQSPYRFEFWDAATTASFQIGTFQDRLTEPDETIVLSLANPIGVTLGKQTNATVTIVNGGPAVSFADTFGQVSENEKFAILTVHSLSDTNLPFSVDYATKDGTAKAGVDYTPAVGTLAFAAGATEKTLSIPLADDGLVDGDKTFRVCLTNATGGASIVAGDATVFINDNEVPANLDYSFGSTIVGAVIDLAALPDDKLLIAGYFTRVNGVERSGLACLNADGSLATAFQTRLLSTGQPGEIYQVTPLADGRVYIAGNFDSVNGVDRPGLALLLQDGSLDLSFFPTNLNYWS